MDESFGSLYMNIFYINVIEQHAGWGAECFVNKGFISNGHQTINLDFKKFKYNLCNKFLEIYYDFDVLFLQRGDDFPIELLMAVNRPRFFWASELVSRCRDQDRLLSSKLFDHIFVHSNACRDTIIKNNWQPQNKVSVLLNGFDADVQCKMPEIKKDIDVLFVGSILPRRRQLLDILKKFCNVTEAHVFGKEMTLLFNRAKIVINIHAEDFLDLETRIFEALGCGSFLLTEKLSLETPFISGRHLIEVEDIYEMSDKIRYYLENESEREEIAIEGYKKALAKHTYIKRAKEIAEIFQKNISKNKGIPINKSTVLSYKRKELINGKVFFIKFILLLPKRIILRLIRNIWSSIHK